LLSLGCAKGRLWSREVRFFLLATALLLIYALGRYTYFFTPLYDYLPGVDLFRRPADATYALGAMASIASGYCLHLFLTQKESLSGSRTLAVFSILACLIAAALGVAGAFGHFTWALKPVLLSVVVFIAGWSVLTF